MKPVGVGIGEDADLAIAQVLQVTHTGLGADGHRDIMHLLGGQHLPGPGNLAHAAVDQDVLARDGEEERAQEERAADIMAMFAAADIDAIVCARGGYGGNLSDPVLVFNVYGSNVCGNDALIMGAYWQKVGLKSAPVRLVSHAIAQVAYDGGWHVMDGDLECFFLLRDNETLASDRELARDHDLIKRAHTYGITLADTRRFDESYAAMFVCEDPVTGDRASQPKSTMNMTLRPGEALTWRWGHLTPAKYSWR